MITKIKVFIILMFLSTVQLSSYGQDQVNTNENARFRNALGIGAGFTTGIGVSYRYYFSKFGIQATFGPLQDNDTYRYSAGLTFIYNLIETSKTNFFLYQGNHYFYTREKYHGSYYSFNNQTTKYFNNGVGMGLEFIILKRVSFNLMGGYGVYKNFKYFSLTGETGLYFKF